MTVHKTLVTGGAGFIGSHICDYLIDNGDEVVCVDDMSTGSIENVNHLMKNPNFKLVNMDINDPVGMMDALDGVDRVSHQAAIGSVPRSIEDPIYTNEANIDGFLNMLVASRDAKVKRFVYAASSSSYGDNIDLPKLENMIGNPLSPYAVTKYVNELYANVFANNYEFKTIGLRYFNIFGKRQDPEGAYAAVIPKWISSILKNEDVYINGDGDTSRDFCYVDNAIQINILAAMSSNEESINQVYNVALNDRTSLNELYKMIQDKLMQRVQGLKTKQPIYRDFRPGDVRHSQASIEKAKKLLSYKPKYKISEGLDEALSWYISSLS